MAKNLEITILLRRYNALICFFLFFGTDIVLSRCRPNELNFDASIYFVGIFMSFLFWNWMKLFQTVLPKPLQWTLALCLGVLIPLLWMANGFTFLEIGQFISVSMVHFLLRDPIYLWGFLKVYLWNWTGGILLISAAFFAFLWSPASAKRPLRLREYLTLLLIPCIYISFFVSIQGNTKIYKTNMDTSLIFALFGKIDTKIADTKVMPGLHAGDRMPLIAKKEPKSLPPNVILFINESFGKALGGLSFYGHADNAMPFLTALIETNKNDFFIFQNSVTTSTATDVSLPAMFTGVGPERSSHELHHAPLIWDWMRAANKEITVFFSSPVVFRWAGLSEFLEFSKMQATFTADGLEQSIVNDLGIDEAISAQKFATFIAEAPKEQPFIGIYFSNALHAPFQTRSSFFADQAPEATRSHQALRILDESFKMIWAALVKKDVLQDTILVITGDHGEIETPVHHGHRLYSFYEEYFGVPLIFMIPQKIQAQIPEKMTRFEKNLSSLTSSLDIAPTLIDLFAVKDGNHEAYSLLNGNSLFEEISADRIVIALNTNETRRWAQEGFGIAKGSQRFLFNTVTGFLFSDIQKDPSQNRNLWNTLSTEEKIFYLETVRKNIHLSRMAKEILE